MGAGFLSAAALLALAAFVSGAAIAECDGRQDPDWDQCDKIHTYLQNNVQGVLKNSYPYCTLVAAVPGDDPDTINCHFTFCPSGPDVAMFYSSVDPGYAYLDTDCRPNKAGGTYHDDNKGFDLVVSNNPSYNPPRARSAEVLDERDHARDFINKRQQASDDDYTLVIKSSHIERDNTRQILSGRLPAGSKYTTSKSSSSTAEIGASVSAGASFFDIFTASVEISTSYSMTTTHMSGVQVNIDCDSGQSGEVYWVPLFTEYDGFYTPSHDNCNWFIPEDTTESATNFLVVCLADDVIMSEKRAVISN